MSSTETTRPDSSQISFGSTLGKYRKNVYLMSMDSFHTLGTTIKEYLGERRTDFNLTMQLFNLSATEFTELNAFLILEELSILYRELGDEYSQQLYDLIIVLRKQAIREYRITTTFN